jgi:DNA-binding cell septation regulator SpoVG
VAAGSGRDERTAKVRAKNNQEREREIMVTVENIKPITGAGNLRAFATVNIAGKLRIADVRIIQQPNQEPWVSMPSRAYEANGQRKWAAIVELIDEALKKEVSEAVLAEYAELESVPQSSTNNGGGMVRRHETPDRRP